MSRARAGLFSFSLFLLLAFFGLSLAAPIHRRSASTSDLAERYDESDLLPRSSRSGLAGREFATADSVVYSRYDYLERRSFSDAYDRYVERDLDNLFTLNERDVTPDFEYDFTKRDLHTLHRRSVAAKIRHAFSSAFHKVGHFFKTTGAKIAKFGLKIVAAGAAVLSKVAKVVPVFGTGMSAALKGVAKGASVASDKIHANLGKLNKVDKDLNYVINPVGTAGKKLGKGGKVLGALFG